MDVVYNFDEIVDRHGTCSSKWESGALMLAAAEAGPSRLTRANVEAMREAVLRGGGTVVAGGIQILAKGNTLFAQRLDAAISGFCVPVSPEGTALPDGRTLRIRPLTEREAENPQKFYKFVFHNPRNYDTIQNNVVARSRRPGDSFRPAGRGLSKPLRKLFSEERVSPLERDRRLVLEWKPDGELIWVEGLGASQAWSAGGQTAGVYLVEIENEGAEN